MSESDKRTRNRIIVALAIFAVCEAVTQAGLLDFEGGLWVEFAMFLVPYAIAGHDVLYRAVRGIAHGQVFDENFLMTIATIGAFGLVFFPESDPHMAEGAAVMLFYQVGELFQSYAVGKSRASIAEMMDIAPDYANVMRDGELVQVDPYDVEVGAEIVVKPGERVPLDGIVVEGSSEVDTSALTGESIPRTVAAGEQIVSGCVNMTGLLTVRVTAEYGDSTVTRILELVEEASERKAKTENFITRFARYYTPIVVCLAVLLAIPWPSPPFPDLFGRTWAESVESALVFLVVSCPCALVISVPLAFFGGIGAASRSGILVKGSSHLEMLSKVRTVAFDKTGTLTDGSFCVVAVHPEANVDPDEVLRFAAHSEAYSNHPIALSVKESYQGVIDTSLVEEVRELGGKGVISRVDGRSVVVGNAKLMAAEGIDVEECTLVGTVLYVAVDGKHIGHVVIADVVKAGAPEAIAALSDAGVKRMVMLTGDREDVASAVAEEVGVGEWRSGLMPEGKVACVEELLAELGSGEGGESGESGGSSAGSGAFGGGSKRRGRLAFVGDGINDAPVLVRADVGIAMGAMGSDAAIEAADVVLMDDDPAKIATSMRIARHTMRIVWQNIVFAIGVKIAIMVLAVFGIAGMWIAVFGDVGVACLAILNSMRALRAR